MFGTGEEKQSVFDDWPSDEPANPLLAKRRGFVEVIWLTVRERSCERRAVQLGVTEESDAIAIVVSEETGNISICHRGKIERGFKAGQFERRLSELLLREDDQSENSEDDTLPEPDTTPRCHEATLPEELAGQIDGFDRRHRGLVPDQEERRCGARPLGT